MKESTLVRKMVKHMRAQGAYANKTHGNMYSSGIPDIVGCYRGVYLGLEAKVPGRENTVTELQQAQLDKIEEAGGVSAVVTSIQDVDDALAEAEELMLGGEDD